MRILLYLLAMLTGITAAQAARPVEAVAPTSAAAELSVAGTVLASTVSRMAECPVQIAGYSVRFTGVGQTIRTAATVRASTPVSRADCART